MVLGNCVVKCCTESPGDSHLLVPAMIDTARYRVPSAGSGQAADGIMVLELPTLPCHRLLHTGI